jgi:hypothetical protein
VLAAKAAAGRSKEARSLGQEIKALTAEAKAELVRARRDELARQRHGRAVSLRDRRALRKQQEREAERALVRRPLQRSCLAAVVSEIYLCNVCSCQDILRRRGRG